MIQAKMRLLAWEFNSVRRDSNIFPDFRLSWAKLKKIGKRSGAFQVYRDKCAGAVTFDFLEGKIVGKEAGLKIQTLATPHAVIEPVLRSKGIVSFLYQRALKSGLTLVSETHTEMAALLWTKLATRPGINLYHFEAGKKLLTQTPTSIKILTTKRI